jgi:hypothetical protein
LELPAYSAIHDVFHVSQLRAAAGWNKPISSLPRHLTAELELLVAPEKLLGVRYDSDTSPDSLEVRIKWQDLPDSEATWEKFAAIQNHFPNIHLEDKVRLWGAGNVTPPIRCTYVRRAKAAIN